MNKFDLAIIIPTLNEEKYIGKLLSSILDQSVQPKELVIVDAFSKDKTKEVVLSFKSKLPQLKFFQIPKSTISRQRNYGARKTNSPNLLFLDADALLKIPTTLETYLSEVQEKNPDIAVCFNLPLSSYWKNKVYFAITNSVIFFTQKTWPVSPATNMYVKRTTFKKVNGFDENVRIGEDVQLIQKIIKNKGKFEILRKTKIYTSTRRLDKEGRSKYALKLIKAFFYVRKHGFRGNPIEYELGNH